MHRRSLLKALAAIPAAGFAAPSFAQTYPDRPIKLIVPYLAGGATDVGARVVAERMAKGLGQPIVIDNRPGAGVIVGTNAVAKADADGYTALAISTGHSASAVTVKQLPYDPVASFAPVGILASSAYVVAVPKSSPATDLKSLVEYVNKEAGKLNYATVTVGSTQHLIAEDVRQRTGMDAKHLSVRTTGDVITALLRGDAAFGVELYHAVRGQVEAGDLKLIAVSTPERWPAAPSVPTLAESGLAGFGYSGWYGLMFPAGVPQSIIDKLHKALQQELSRDDVRKRLEGAGAHAGLSAPADLSKLIAAEIASFGAVAAKAGIEPK